jgi:hypothetical protein
MAKLNDLLAEYQKDRNQIKYRRSGVWARLLDDPEIQIERLSDEIELVARWRTRVEEALSTGVVSSIDSRKFESDLKATAKHASYRLLASVTDIAIIVAGLTALITTFAMDPAARIPVAVGAIGIILWWQVVRRLERRSVESRARAALEFAQICSGARATQRPRRRPNKQV